MDQHAARSLHRTDPDGTLRLPPEALADGSVFHGMGASVPEPVEVSDIRLGPGELGIHPVAPWSRALLRADAGFCLTGTDGESPELHAGSFCLYRVRNRPSEIVLVAGPGGFEGRLFLAPPD